MVTIEVRGIPCAINENFDDIELVEIAVAIERGDSSKRLDYCKKILGEEQYENVKESLRGDDGVCKFSDVYALVEECVVRASEMRHAEAKN